MLSNFLQSFPDDSLPSTAAESWVREKVGLIGEYLSVFTAQVAGRVNDVIFIDLYSGNGMYAIGSKKELFPSSALMALSLGLPVSRYVFCEKDPERLSTLKIRVNRNFRQRNVVLLDGKPEEIIHRLELYVPPSKGNYKSAVFCLCDPFSIEMPFECMERLADKGYSFLVPFTFAMNDRLDYQYYLVENRERLKRFLGMDSLERLEMNVDSNVTFYKRLVMLYQNKMLAMGFNASTSVTKLDSGLMELPVYYTGFFSKLVPAKDIQDDVDSGHRVQFQLF